MKKLLLSGLVAFSVWQSLAYADDTDIYLRIRPEGTEPYLMLTFDYRNDMASNFCNGWASCKESAGGDGPLWDSLKDVTGAIDEGVGSISATNMQALIAVLQTVIQDFNGIYVGLMMPNKTRGGTILRGFELFEEGDSSSKDELIDILKMIPTTGTGSKSYHAVSPKELHYEFWRYLNGQAPKLGMETLDNFPDLPPPPEGQDPYADLRRTSNDPFYDDITYMPPSSANVRYESPFADALDDVDPTDYSCVRLFEVHATSGNDASGNGDKNLDNDIKSMYFDPEDAARADAASGKGYKGMVQHLANSDLIDDAFAPGKQSLKSWYIQMGSAATDADDWARIMGTSDQENYMAIDGKNSSLKNIERIMREIFIEALRESSTFVSASVPVNVFNRIQTLDNFYIALFEANTGPRWPGNLKKLRLADTTGSGGFDEIVDARGNPAFLDEDGRIRDGALTIWTDPAQLRPADPDKEGEIDDSDGRSVNRGGAGQKIPGFREDNVGTHTLAGSRQVYVEPLAGPVNGTAVDFDKFDADLATLSQIVTGAPGTDFSQTADVDAMEALFGTRDVNTALDLIKWGRGLDVNDEDDDPNTINRRWVLGDAIHSRPLALNYGATGGGYTTDNPNIRLFMGTNDGFFHIFEDTDAAGNESGEELFTFIPRESLPVLKKLSGDELGVRHPYGVDGEPVALVVDNNLNGTIEPGDSDEVYVYVGMRRGGKSYYALDVSDPSPSAVPDLKWKITKTSGGDFDELGYTFSTPRVIKVQYGGQVVDALIFAGGYDLNKDTPKVADLTAADTEGNAIYVVDARTGALIWKAVDGSGTDTNTKHHHTDLDHSIPSSIATLDSNSNGIVDRAYVGDTGGVVWRIDLPEGKNPSDSDHRVNNWTITKFADLGDNTEAGDRRFFHQPDIVQTRDIFTDANGEEVASNYDGVLIASGDRPNPLESDDENYLYLLKDRATTSGAPDPTALTHADVPDTTACVTAGDAGCPGTDQPNYYRNGWKIALPGDGEKGLASPITADGEVFFTTYQPTLSLANCQPSEGNGFLYVVNLADGTAKFNKRHMDIGPGIPPQVTALGSDALIVPGSGMLEDPDAEEESQERNKLVDTEGKGMYIIYWREPGVDRL